MKIERERVHGLWEESAPLVAAGFKAFDPFPEIPLEVDRAVYEQLEDAGALRVYTAREGAELVGYVVFMVMVPPRRRQILIAQQDILHTSSKVGPHVAMGLVRHAERALADEGVNLVYHSSPIGGKFGQLLEMLHYRPIMQVHAKVLK